MEGRAGGDGCWRLLNRRRKEAATDEREGQKSRRRQAKEAQRREEASLANGRMLNELVFSSFFPHM